MGVTTHARPRSGVLPRFTRGSGNAGGSKKPRCMRGGVRTGALCHIALTVERLMADQQFNIRRLANKQRPPGLRLRENKNSRAQPLRRVHKFSLRLGPAFRASISRRVIRRISLGQQRPERHVHATARTLDVRCGVYEPGEVGLKSHEVGYQQPIRVGNCQILKPCRH